MKRLMNVRDVVRQAGRLPMWVWLVPLLWAGGIYVAAFVEQLKSLAWFGNWTVYMFWGPISTCIILAVLAIAMLGYPNKSNLRRVCKNLPERSEAVQIIVEGMVRERLDDLVGQIRALQALNTQGSMEPGGANSR